VGKTLDWVDLQFVPSIEVPGDAWVDWDAENQVFITASAKLHRDGDRGPQERGLLPGGSVRHGQVARRQPFSAATS
jgi:hypothetical protein